MNNDHRLSTKVKTITAAYYSFLLNPLKPQLQKNRQGLDHKKVLFNHDHEPAHTSAVWSVN
uniref:Histonelysine Nmethyltransferase SETMARlike [Hydra vulgaris] n=1 Tax=Lepeophtheirus salmonis TaxID=72036 RepID=A0A0K2UWD1_LEPSM